ncbi:MAG: hypothetical protein HZB15_07270 [Actinobacteria bacterium]|nr:hypothetical protein [Actinomycetota bacterium]
MSDVVHLAKRFAGSLSRTPPAADDEAWAETWLSPGEVALWRTMSNVDRRHAIEVARRFRALRPDAPAAEMAGALLHDVGKVESGLGTWGRVVATVVGPRTPRFRTYHDHEAIGARWLDAAGAAAATVELVHRRGPAAAALEAADDI